MVRHGALRTSIARTHMHRKRARARALETSCHGTAVGLGGCVSAFLRRVGSVQGGGGQM